MRIQKREDSPSGELLGVTFQGSSEIRLVTHACLDGRKDHLREYDWARNTSRRGSSWLGALLVAATNQWTKYRNPEMRQYRNILERAATALEASLAATESSPDGLTPQLWLPPDASRLVLNGIYDFSEKTFREQGTFHVLASSIVEDAVKQQVIAVGRF